ncbi:D-2-hydroxyacid dehydrogenase [Kaarinaea lacus]
MKYNICFLDRSTLRHDIIVRTPEFLHEWTEYDRTSAEQTSARIQKMDIIITNKVAISEQLIENNPELKMIAVAATGVDHIDLDACRARNITVSNIRDYALHTVPEHVIGVMLALRRQTLQYRQEVIRGRWQKAGSFCFFDEPIHDINGATLGVIGYGALGQATAGLAHALGMQVQYFSPSEKDSSIARRVELDELLTSSDVISLHCPLNPDTHHLLDSKAFTRMKPGTIVINTARGAIVDEQALAEAITSKQIAGAAIDVLPQEPPTQDSPMMKLAGQTNVILTPHIAWASQQAMQTLADQLIDNIEAFVSGQPQNRVG